MGCVLNLANLLVNQLHRLAVNKFGIDSNEETFFAFPSFPSNLSNNHPPPQTFTLSHNTADEWEICRSSIQLIKCLGEGHYGKVSYTTSNLCKLQCDNPILYN